MKLISKPWVHDPCLFFLFGAALQEICTVAVAVIYGYAMKAARVDCDDNSVVVALLHADFVFFRNKTHDGLLVIPLKQNKDRRTYTKYACKFLLTVALYSTLST